MTQTLPVHLSREWGRLVNVALVGGLHIGAIYTLLVALDVVPNPVAPSPAINLKIFEPQAKIPPIPVAGSGPTLRHPTMPHEPAEPVVRSQEASHGRPNAGTESAVPTTVDFPPTSGAVLPPRAIGSTHTVPPYPPLAMRLGFQGSVRLQISVDEHGKVIAAVVEVSSGHPGLDAAAVSWVEKQWRYEPAMRNGLPIAASTSAVVTFRLNQARF